MVCVVKGMLELTVLDSIVPSQIHKITNAEFLSQFPLVYTCICPKNKMDILKSERCAIRDFKKILITRV